jgi:subtilisin
MVHVYLLCRGNAGHKNKKGIVMAREKTRPALSQSKKTEFSVSATPDELLQAAMERGGETLETGRYLVTYHEGAADEGLKLLKTQGFSVADARDFKDQAVSLDEVGGAEAVMFPEIGVALVGGAALEQHGLRTQTELPMEGPVETIEPEYFVFAGSREYLRGFVSAAETIAKDLGTERGGLEEDEIKPEALGAAWGLVRCKVPPCSRSGQTIKVAILDTGMDLRHPDFAGRSITSRTFVGQPVQDLHGHGTHVTGTACGPMAPVGSTPRYGIAFGSRIFVGKVLTNTGSGTTATVLAGMNWAIANQCEVINMSLGAQSPVQAAYTIAGAVALARGLLIIAAAGNRTTSTGAPANSPTIMSVASLDPALRPSSFSNFGKIEISAPGGDIFSSLPMPRRYGVLSGTSMAAPHVAGCAALWAQTSSALRGMALWRRLQSSAVRLPFPAARVGSGLVQAP